MNKKKPLILMAVMAILALGLFTACSDDKAPESKPVASKPAASKADKDFTKDAYDIFSMVMNKVSGEGKWSAAGNEVDEKTGVLTVKGLKITLPEIDPEMAEAAAAKAEETETAEAAKEAAEIIKKMPPQVVEIETVAIRNGIHKDTLTQVLALTDWKDQKETKLAEEITVKGIKFVAQMPEDLKGSSASTTGEEFTAHTILLSASTPQTPAGMAGFLKSLRVGGLAYKNFVSTFSDDEEATVEVRLGSASADTVAFDAEPVLTGLESLDPHGLLPVLSATSAKMAGISDLSMTLNSKKDDTKFSFVIKNVEEKDIQGTGKIGQLVLNGLDFNLDTKDVKAKEVMPFVFKLDKMTMNKVDMTPYLKKYMPVFVMMAHDPEKASEMMMSVQTFADYIVAPYSLDDVSASGFEFSMGKVLSIKMAETVTTGPFKAGEITPKVKFTLKGLEVALPSDPALAADKDLKDLYEFTRDFGMSTFIIDAESDSTYDAAKGIWALNLTKFSVKDLYDTTMNFEMGGMTKEQIDKLKNTPLSALYMFMFAPDQIDQVLGDMSIKSLKLNLVDKSLFDRSFKMGLKKNMGPTVDDATVDAAKQMLVAQMPAMINAEGGKYLKNPEAVSKPLAAFVSKPGNIEISIIPNPELSMKTGKASVAGGDFNKLLDSLNIIISTNGEKSEALKFNLPK